LSHTGLTPKKFGELSIEFRVEWKRITSHFTIEDKPRQRIILPRKTNVLPEVQYKLQLILIQLNTYPMWGFQAIIYMMQQSQTYFGYTG